MSKISLLQSLSKSLGAMFWSSGVRILPWLWLSPSSATLSSTTWLCRQTLRPYTSWWTLQWHLSGKLASLVRSQGEL